MFKLIKWTAGGILAVGLLLYLVFGASAPSYVGTVLGEARKTVKEAIPIQFEIRRSERLIREIYPQIQACIKDVATGEVEMEELKEDIALLEKRVRELHDRVLRRKNLLESGKPVYYIAGLRMERNRLEMDLGRVFEEYRNCVSLLQGKKRLLSGQQRALEAARRKLAAVLNERARLQDMLKSLKAQKRQVDSLAAQSRKFDLDDSNLVQAREALKEVKKRLDVAQKMLEADFLDTAGLEEAGEGKAGKDILAEVERYFRREARNGRAPGVTKPEMETVRTLEARPGEGGPLRRFRPGRR